MRIGSPAGSTKPVTFPLEVYVARVLAGEAEPKAPDAAMQALAIAIRTYALVNAGRHGREGFDLCDTTHCQVPRAATPVTRRAALATVGQVLTHDGVPAAVSYSASCGGRGELASEVWPGAADRYRPLPSDDVHADDAPWVIELSLEQLEDRIEEAGISRGSLRDVSIEARNPSGRVSRVRLDGMRPAVIGGTQLRTVIGTTVMRSTAFSISRHPAGIQFSGQGYGHGVGLCVIGAGRRARRGETVSAILAQYYPGLEVRALDGRRTGLDSAISPAPRVVVVTAPGETALRAAELERIAERALVSLSKRLGVSGAPLTIHLHPTMESFRAATGRPWWTSAVVSGTTIDLAPASVLAQREGLEATIRVAVAERLVSAAIDDGPLWVRVGAARYFAPEIAPGGRPRQVRCPTDAELSAVSAAAQREAEARAEACFARALAERGDWREVR